MKNIHISALHLARLQRIVYTSLPLPLLRGCGGTSVRLAPKRTPQTTINKIAIAD